MKIYPPEGSRTFKTVDLACDLAVAGGGMAGTCCAITAARAGLKVALIQDRPVLGGNASSEVRLWVLGATSHMGNNNRWAREGGVIDEILIENNYRNKEGNPLIFDTVVLEKVSLEPNITLCLNTAVVEVVKSSPDRIAGLKAFCSQNSTLYDVRAPLFVDASGDGVVGFLSGAAFRVGAENREEFGELHAPDVGYGELLGHSIYFYTKDTGKPVRYVAPSFALKDITTIPRWRQFNASDHGCNLWWIEYGGRLDTVHDTEKIKWELWKVAYGVWDYIKNSGKFPEAANLTLEWFGTVPGKRESRRFEGPLLLNQHDLVGQKLHEDGVSHGGWSIDLHPADGVYSPLAGSSHWHSRGMYQIPYRSLFSRNISNLFLAGRTLSVTHVAFGSTRVIGTLSEAAQAVGMAAAHCVRQGIEPAGMLEPGRMRKLQLDLLRRGQHIPSLKLKDENDLAAQAKVKATSRYKLDRLAADGPLLPLEVDRAQILPLSAGPVPTVTFEVVVQGPTELELELRTSDRTDNHTPDVVLGKKSVKLVPGENKVHAAFDAVITEARYVFYILKAKPGVSVRTSLRRVTGILQLGHYEDQTLPGHDNGMQEFEFWRPDRRPLGHNLAMVIEPPLDAFGPENALELVQRPTSGSNAWLAGLDDPKPSLRLDWDGPRELARVDLVFDVDWDHGMESVLRGQPEAVMPFCVKHYRLSDESGKVLVEVKDNHQARNQHDFSPAVRTQALVLELLESHGEVPKALFNIRCYAAPY